MQITAHPFTRNLLLTALLATFSAQALATTYVYRLHIPGLKESMSSLAARTVPFIDHTLPSGGDTAGGNTMAIYATPDGLNPLYGHGFATGTTVSVDGVLVSSTLQGVVSPGMGGSLNVLMPFHAVGTAQVVITDPRGATVSAPYAYTHNVTVSAVTPASALTAGIPLTVNGTGFVSGSSVSIDGVPAQLTAAYSTQLVATAPAHAPGAATLTVTNPDTSSFTFTGLNYGMPATANISATTFNAGTVTVGQSVQTATATVSNTGDFALNYAALSALPAGWTKASGAGACNAAGGSIAARSTCTLTFTFAPTTASQVGGSVSFTPTTAGVASTPLSLIGTAASAQVYSTLNPAAVSSTNYVVLSADKLTFTNNSNWQGARGLYGKSSGKWYYEVTFKQAADNGNVGLATSVAGLAQVGDSNGYSLAFTRAASWMVEGGQTSVGVQAGGAGDTVGIGFDGTAKSMYAVVYSASTQHCSIFYSTALPAYWSTATVFPAISSGGGSGHQLVINSGQTAFKCAPPAGFNAGWWQ